MPSSHLLLEEPIRMASILEPSKAVSFSITLSYCFQFQSIDLVFVIIDLIEIVVDGFCRAFFLQ